MITECAREAEIMDAVAFARWPAECPELAAHAASCEICADLVETARALHEDREELCREAHPPAAGLVWWRATIRARAEAARTAAQPITILQGVAGACIAGAAAGLVTAAWHSSNWIERIASASAVASGHGLPILLAVSTGIVLAPLALYLTLADD